MDDRIILAVFAILALLVLAVIFRYKGTSQAEFSLFKWLTFRFKGRNQSSRGTTQEAGVKVEPGAQLTAQDVVGRDKITNVYGTSPEKNMVLSQSLLTRLKFLDDINENSNAEKLEQEINDLVKFIERLQQGAYFAHRISALTERPQALVVDVEWPTSEAEYQQQYREKLREARSQIYSLVDELLQLQ